LVRFVVFCILIAQQLLLAAHDWGGWLQLWASTFGWVFS